MNRRPNLLRRFQLWRARCEMEKRIVRLSEAERRDILAKSPYEALVWQGEGYHVVRKGGSSLAEDYVDTIGEVAPRDAEDWLIARWLEDEDRRAGSL